MTTHWCIYDGAPVRTKPGKGIKLMSLAKYMRVDVMETTTALYNNMATAFHRVFLPEGMRQATEGWVYAGYLDRYSGHAANTKVLYPTKNPHDAKQYLVWDGGVQYNLCGFFCIAQCLGWESSIEEFLDMLKDVKPPLMAALFNTKNRGLTGVRDLIQIVTALGHEPPLILADILKDRVTGAILNSPGRMANILSGYRVIYGVKINPRSGRITRSGIQHWVVLNDINVMDFGGIVEVYNPFDDRHEAYEWDQIVESGWGTAGVLLPRSLNDL